MEKLKSIVLDEITPETWSELGKQYHKYKSEVDASITKKQFAILLLSNQLKIYKAKIEDTNCNNKRIQEFNSIQELLDLCKKEECPIIINEKDIHSEIEHDFQIEIFNDYRD